MTTTRRALGDATPGSLSWRVNESGRLLTTLRKKINNENPFATKSRLSRTPDAFTIRKRQRTFSILVESPVPCFEYEIDEVEKKEMMSITSADEYEKADYKWHQDPTPLDVMINDAPLKFIVGFPHLEIESSSGPKTEFDFEEDDVDEKIKKIMPSSMAVNTINIKSTLVTKQKKVNTEKLNIDEVLQEVLQAFRENAETAERALIMATACGKLHPKQFREYLIAFMSPHRGGKITEVGNKSMHENKDKNDATNEGEKKTENEKMPIDYLGIDHLAAKLAKTEQGLFQPSGQYYFVPAHYDQPKVLEFLSPKSSFLDMLEGADTPVASSNISKKVCSPLAENMRECPFSINDCQDSVNPNVENSVVTSGECIGNAVENRHQSLKSRTEAVRLVVATAVASVSEMANPTLAHFYSVPPVTQCVKAPDSSGHIAFQMMTTAQIARTTIASNIDMLMLPSTSTVDKNIPRDQNDEGGPGRAVFFPRKLMMRTPPKHLPKDNVRASDPIVCTPSTALNVHMVGNACPGSGEVKHTTQEQNVASGNEVNTLEYILTNTLRVPMGNNSSMAILENVHSNSADGILLRNDNDQWSSKELEHVAAVIRKVSADRSNLSRGMYQFTSTESDDSTRLHSTKLDSTSLRCLKATNASSDFNISSGSNKYGNQQIVSRLKKEIDQLRNQINNHTSEMAQVIAETKLLFRRLSEAEFLVEKSSKVDIKKRSAAYNQERIDAEIIAAKVSAESLAARKRIIIQRRADRERRVIIMDQEVVAELGRVDAARFRNKKKPNYDVDKIVSIADSLECSSEKENIPLELSFLPTSNTPPFFTENMNKNDEMMQRNNKKNDSSKSANSIKIVKSQIIELFSSLNSSSAKSKLLSHVFVPSHDCVFHVPQRLKSQVGPISFDEAENDPSVGSRSGVKFKKEENEGDFFERIESVSATAFPTLVSLKINTNKLDRIGDGNKGDEDANLKESGGDKETEVSVFRQGENVDVKVGFEENAIIISNDNNYDDDGDGNISNSTYSRIMYNDESNLLTYEISSNNDISLYSRQAVRTNDALYSKNEVISARFTDKDGNQNDHRKQQILENFENNQDDNDDVKTAKKIENKNNKIIYCGNLKFVPLKGKSCKQISANEIEYKNILFKTTVKIDSKENGNGSDKKSKEEDYVKEGNMKIKTREIIESKDADQSDVINDTEIFDEFLNLSGEKGEEICNKTIEIFSKNLDVKKSLVPEIKEKSPKTRGTSSELLASECSKNISENGEEISPVETSLKFDDMVENLVTAEKEKDVKKLTRIKKIKIKSDMGKMKSMTGMKKEETKTDLSKAIDSDDFHDNIPLNSVARLSSRLPDSDSIIITAADSRGNTFSLPFFPPLSPHRPSLEVCTNTFSAGAITSNLLKNMPSVRTMTPYALYCTEKYCEMNQKHPHHTPSGIVKLLSIEWKSLTKNEKKIWIQNSNLTSVVVEPVEEVVAVGKVVKEIECVVKSKEEPERAISAINDDLLDRVDNIQDIQIEEKSSNQNKKNTKKKNEDESNKKKLKRVRNKTSADDGSSKKRQTLNFRSDVMKTIKGPSTGYSSDGESSYSNADLLQFLMRTRAGIDATSTENDQNATTSNKIKADEMIALKQEKTQGAFSITKTFLPFSIVAKHDLSSEFRKFELKSTLMPPPSPPLKKNKKRAPESRSRSGPRSTSLSVSINNSIKSYVNFLPVGPIGSTLDKKNRNVEYTKISNNSPFNSSVSTVCSAFSTASTVGSKSKFVLPKLKK